jgi:hypothetical protein
MTLPIVLPESPQAGKGKIPPISYVQTERHGGTFTQSRNQKTLTGGNRANGESEDKPMSPAIRSPASQTFRRKWEFRQDEQD